MGLGWWQDSFLLFPVSLLLPPPPHFISLPPAVLANGIYLIIFLGSPDKWLLCLFLTACWPQQWYRLISEPLEVHAQLTTRCLGKASWEIRACCQSEMSSPLVLPQRLGSWHSLNRLVDCLLRTKPDANRITHPLVSWYLSSFINFAHILKLV